MTTFNLTENNEYTASGIALSFCEPQELFPQLPALARRLGVEPNTRPGEMGRTLLVMKNGDKYDLFDIMNAFLDKIEVKS